MGCLPRLTTTPSNRPPVGIVGREKGYIMAYIELENTYNNQQFLNLIDPLNPNATTKVTKKSLLYSSSPTLKIPLNPYLLTHLNLGRDEALREFQLLAQRTNTQKAERTPHEITITDTNAPIRTSFLLRFDSPEMKETISRMARERNISITALINEALSVYLSLTGEN